MKRSRSYRHLTRRLAISGADSGHLSWGGLPLSHVFPLQYSLNEANFRKLIASECGMNVNGLEMGDMQIMFLGLARKGLITYDSVLQLHAIMSRRSESLLKRIEEERAIDAMRRKHVIANH